eukprot:364378-Chlamydomonas_euryale.AAC.16
MHTKQSTCASRQSLWVFPHRSIRASGSSLVGQLEPTGFENMGNAISGPHARESVQSGVQRRPTAEKALEGAQGVQQCLQAPKAPKGTL